MIGIVTVNWRGFAVTKTLVSQILAGDTTEFRLAVVNNSPDEAALFPQDPLFNDARVQIVHTAANVGYAGGLNLGLKTLLPDPAVQHFLLMNNDVEIPVDFLQRMIACCRDPKAIYAPLILLRNTDRIQNTGGRIHLWLGGTTNINKNTPVHQARRIQPDFLSGCLLFLHRGAIENIGFFEESFGSYYEDVDYCLRARAAGFRLEVLWDIPVRHFHSHATQGAQTFKAYLINRNQIRFARKHLSPLPRLIFITAAVIRGFFQNLLAGRLQGYLNGVREGLR